MERRTWKKHSEFQMGIEARTFQTLLGCFQDREGLGKRRTGIRQGCLNH